MEKIKSFILLSLILMALWLLFAGNIHRDELITGAAVSLLISLIFFKSSVLSEIKLNPKALVFIPMYFIIFIIELIKSNLDVAFRVVNPKLPINPGIVKVKTKLKSRLGRITLANSITLTPGTLTVEVKDDVFYIHWIDVKTANIEETTEEIMKKFEKYLEVIFG